ncbi:HD domain-containing protein [Thaumasiovibrio subtropicus]|uniref:HD domain-containing protein n=1 Tax=Thaumasiovibrio subtropicus TaxID=1891207 RepID=UPI00192CF60F|nr:HD domain-containing protein [Thaumasiovibrio subtropicus]
MHTAPLKTLEVTLTFLREIEKLKTITRYNRTLDGRYENSAEHSWHATLMSLLLVNHSEGNPDPLTVAKMLLIHDIVEIDAGDTWLFDEDQSHKHSDESTAAARLFGLLPEPQATEYKQLWEEFEARQTPEAQFAAAIDGLQPLLNHVLTGRPEDGTLPASTILEKKAYIRAAAPQLWQAVESLISDSVNKGLYTLE